MSFERVVDGFWILFLGQKSVLTRSSSLLSYSENGACDFPDPFPELSRGRLAPASARMYCPETNSLTLNNPEQQQVVELTAGGDSIAFPPAADSGLNCRAVDLGSHSSLNVSLLVQLSSNSFTLILVLHPRCIRGSYLQSEVWWL